MASGIPPASPPHRPQKEAALHTDRHPVPSSRSQWMSRYHWCGHEEEKQMRCFQESLGLPSCGGQECRMGPMRSHRGVAVLASQEGWLLLPGRAAASRAGCDLKQGNGSRDSKGNGWQCQMKTKRVRTFEQYESERIRACSRVVTEPTADIL